MNAAGGNGDGIPDRVTWDIEDCPVCEGEHYGVTLRRSAPVALPDLGGEEATHYYRCPRSGDPPMLVLTRLVILDDGEPDLQPWEEDPDAWKR